MTTLEKLVEMQDKKQWLEVEFEKFGERGILEPAVKMELNAMIEAIEEAPKEIKFLKRNGGNVAEFEAALSFAENELLPLAENLNQYKSLQDTDIWDLISQLTIWTNANSDELYFKFKDLVNMVNAYWNITDEKPANRIAWGWSKCREKDNPRAYLYGCIRNYLKRNNKFDKEEFNKIWFGKFY